MRTRTLDQVEALANHVPSQSGPNGRARRTALGGGSTATASSQRLAVGHAPRRAILDHRRRHPNAYVLGACRFTARWAGQMRVADMATPFVDQVQEVPFMVVRQMPVAEGLQRDEHRPQVESFGGQGELVTDRLLIVADLPDDTFALQDLHPVGQKLRGNSGLFADGFEASATQEKFAQDHQGPGIANQGDGARQGAGLFAQTIVFQDPRSR